MLINRCAKENKMGHGVVGAWVVWALGCGLLGGAGSALALELGDFDLQSHLNEPLEARIRLSAVTADQWQGLQVSVAPPADFRQAGLAMLPVLDRLRFAPMRSAAGEAYIHVLSTEAITAPYLEVVVAAQAGSDRVLKAYTVLLDPPPRRRYGPVKDGEALWSIAKRVKLNDKVTVQQMVVALFDTNPDAFTDNHINQLKIGAFLRIPSLETVTAIPPERASAEMQELEARDRDQPRSQRRAAAPPPPPVTEVVNEATAVNEAIEPLARRDGEPPTQSAAEDSEASAAAEPGVAAVASLPSPVTAPVMSATSAVPTPIEYRSDAPSSVATTLPKGFFDDVVADVRADPVQMGLLGGGLVGLLGFLGLSKRRRRYAGEAAEAPLPSAAPPADWLTGAVIATAAADAADGAEWATRQDRHDAPGKRIEAADDVPPDADLAWRADDAVAVGAAAQSDAAADEPLAFSFEVDDARTMDAAADEEQTMALGFGHLDFNAVDTGSDRTEPAVGDLDALEAQLAADAPFGGAPGAAARDRESALPATKAATAGAVVSAVVGDAGRDNETKLDLAKAYEGMGDLEGARMMLAEVLAEGSEEQRAMARSLMTRLSS